MMMSVLSPSKYLPTYLPKLIKYPSFTHAQHDKTLRDAGDNNSTTNDQSSAGYSPSVVTGIGVGSTLGGVLLLGLVAFLVYRGRQRNRGRALGDQEAGGGQGKGKGKGKQEGTGNQFDVTGAL